MSVIKPQPLVEIERVLSISMFGCGLSLRRELGLVGHSSEETFLNGLKIVTFFILKKSLHNKREKSRKKYTISKD